MMDRILFESAMQGLEEGIISDIPCGKKHRFSRSYKLKKRDILKFDKRANEYKPRSVKKALCYVAIAVILATVLAISTVGLYTDLKSFYIIDQGDTLELCTYDDSGAPSTILKKFRLDCEFNGYKSRVINDDFTGYWVYYSNGDYSINISQETKSYSDNALIDTECVLGEIQTVNINGYNGVYYYNTNGYHVYYLDIKGYVFYISGNNPNFSVDKIVESIHIS